MDLFCSPFLFSMETLKNIIWITLILFTPLMILVFGVINFIKKERLVEILAKSFIAFVLYLSATTVAFISLLIIALSSGSPVPSLNEPPSSFEKSFFETESFAIIVVMSIYTSFGIFLIWFVKRDLGNSLSLITGKTEKMPTLFSE